MFLLSFRAAFTVGGRSHGVSLLPLSKISSFYSFLLGLQCLPLHSQKTASPTSQRNEQKSDMNFLNFLLSNPTNTFWSLTCLTSLWPLTVTQAFLLLKHFLLDNHEVSLTWILLPVWLFLPRSFHRFFFISLELLFIFISDRYNNGA